jgi:hypothetical protein
MRRLTIILFLVTISALTLGAKIIENSAKPPAKNAGRQATLTEVLRIEDDGKNFFFKAPNNLKVGADGSIYLLDDKQFLKFDKSGAFVGNFWKSGEGPGEYSRVFGYTVNTDHIMILAAQPYKIIKLNLSGKLLEEKRLKSSMGFQRVLNFYGENVYYLDTELNFSKIKGGVFEFPQKLFVKTISDQKTDLKLNLPIERFVVVKRPKGGFMIQLRDLASNRMLVENEHRAYFSHTSNYLIKVVDIAEGKILRQFRRQYTPVKYIPTEIDTGPRKMKGFLEKKTTFNDVMALVLFKDRLLVFTSTLDEEKGVLVDIFSKDGKYLDYVYVPLKELHRPDTVSSSKIVADGEFLCLLEKDEEDIFSVVKYKLEF